MTWPIKKLGEVVIIQNGFAFQSSDYTGSGFFVMRIANVQDGIVELNNPKYIQSDKSTSFKKFILHDGDILVSLTGNVGRVGVIQKEHLPAVLNQRVARIIVRDSNQLDHQYLFSFLRSPFFVSEVIKGGHGMAQQNVSTKDIENIEIPLPPLAEQKKIVEKIDKQFAKIDEAARLRAESEAATVALLPAALHEIFSQSESKGWDKKEFSEVVTVESKKNIKKLPYVGMEDVESGTGKFLGSKEIREVKSNTSYFNKDHVLYGKLRPYLNKFLMPDFEGQCSTEFLPLRPDKKSLTREWLMAWLRSDEIVARINATGAGARMPRANMKLVAKFKIPLPPLAEQKEIVKKLDALSLKVRALHELQLAQSADLKALKQSILHEAFAQ